jgi:hypothetical protein
VLVGLLVTAAAVENWADTSVFRPETGSWGKCLSVATQRALRRAETLKKQLPAACGIALLVRDGDLKASRCRVR